jgi:3'-5' exoribonuclease
MRQYFSDLLVGDFINMPLLVVAVSPRKTKANKPYLNLELFDGRDKMVANYWDWAGVATPRLNDTVYTVSGLVSEYNGQKQINVQAINTDKSASIFDFMPSCGKDIAEVFKSAYTQTNNVKDDLLRDLALAALDNYKEAWLITPSALGVHHAYVGGNLIHCLSVATLACDISKHVPESNDDICFVGGLLHDLGKLFTYKLDGVSIIMTDDGRLLEHAYMGAAMLDGLVPSVTIKNEADADKIRILRHIILSHHGTLDFGAVTEPQCMEAHIVHHADELDAKIEVIREASDKTTNMWTDKLWTLSNRQMLNYHYMQTLEPTTYDDEHLPIE